MGWPTLVGESYGLDKLNIYIHTIWLVGICFVLLSTVGCAVVAWRLRRMVAAEI